MDHNLEDSLTLGSTMEDMDFEASDVVVSQEDLNLATSSNEGSIPMEFEQIEEQPMLLGSEEIIVPDFMGDQFNLQEYSIQDDETTGMTTVENSNQSILAAQSETMLDLQYQPQTITNIKTDEEAAPTTYIAVKAAPSARLASAKKDTKVVTTVPRQVAIAPKPPKNSNKFPQTKPLAIAPKPVAVVSSFMKNVPFVQQSKGTAVLAQIGKQVVVLPQGGAKKIKLLNTNTGISTVQYLKTADQAQLIPAKNISAIPSSKPVLTKLIVPGQTNTEVNEPTVIRKLIQTTSSQPRYIMQQKTVPISVSKEAIMASPKQGSVKITKKPQQVVEIKSTTSKIVPVSTISTVAPTKKMIITPNPTQNVILKTTAPPKAQVIKDGKVVVQSQRSQLHQINVPGKGIQYIRLITNQVPTTSISTTSPPTPTPTPTTSVVSKGQLIQVVRKVGTSQPPPLVFTGTLGPNDKLLGAKKLVRLAAPPFATKPSTVTQQQVSVRSAQSLLAPLSPPSPPSPRDPPPADLDVVLKSEPNRDMEDEMEANPEVEDDSAIDSKATLQDILIQDGLQGSMEIETSDNAEDVQSFKTQADEHPLIVISSNYMQNNSVSEEPGNQEDVNNMMNFKEMAYQSEDTPPDSDVTPSEFGFRPKRACNCTKSQCLKLYCDCFANGEFCNQCNCHNCLNNLDNEELRQKAIRTCLERNPNAFRPKIGKGKVGGPEIIRRHNKGCNCKRSGCLKNYCECYEAKIACTATCKCVGCRNVEDALQRRRAPAAPYRPPPAADLRQPCNFMTTEVIEAVCQCLVAAAAEGSGEECARGVLEEFSRCLQDIIGASRHAAPTRLMHEERA